MKERARVSGLTIFPLQLAIALAGCDGTHHNSCNNGVERQVSAVVPAVVKIRGRGGMAQAQGSGFYILGEAKRALLVTNQHVIWAADEIIVDRNDGVTDTATLIAADAATDIALLLPALPSAPTVLTLGSDAELRQGDQLISVGSAAGVLNAASVGVLSARSRVPEATLVGEQLTDYLFTDASLGSGASGGPVLDGQGHVVGMTAAAMGGGRSLSVVVPADLMALVLRDLQAKGRSDHGFIGIDVADEPGNQSFGAVCVRSIARDGPADEEQLAVGDHITALDGVALHGARDFRLRIFSSAPGVSRKFAIVRKSRKLSTDLQIRQLPASN